MESLLDGIQYLVDFFSGEQEVSIWDHIQAQIIIWYLKIKIFAVSQAWSVSYAVLQQLEISSAINAAFASLDGTIGYIMSLFKVPEAINILVQAHVTRMVLNVMGV